MTADQRTLGGPLGRRLLGAFLLVALSSVAVLTLAALIATDRGLTSAAQRSHRESAARVAVQAAEAYARTGDWAHADLAGAAAVASAADAWLVVRDVAGNRVWPVRGMGAGTGGTHRELTAGPMADAAITVGGRRVGDVHLTFPADSPTGRTVAWSWIAGAAAVALTAALGVSAYVSRRLARPLITLAATARRFAAGERTARTGLRAPGELGEVAHALDTMADEVVRVETVRRHLAADIAHELRTPLAGLQAGLEELRDGLRPADAARLAALHDQSLRLGRIVQDLSDLSAAESAALSVHLVDTDLTSIATAALAAHRARLAAAGLRVTTELDTPAPVRADPDRLHQAVGNLLANAARYSRPADRIHISVGTEAGQAVLQVSDTGPGIPTDELPYVFDRLWRGRDAMGTTGSGIGLAVVRELVTAHGGTVTIASPAEGGVTVTVRLPLNDTHHTMPARRRR